MNYILPYALENWTNYSYLNRNNIYNLLLFILDDIDDEQKLIKYCNAIKTQCGLSFHTHFMNYVRRKLPQHKLLKF